MLNGNILIESLQVFASKDMQEKLWMYGDKNQMSSFEEACCGVFDDSGLTRAIDSGYLQKHFSVDLCEKVQDFDRFLGFLPSNARPEEVINHPKMGEVRKLAGELLELFAQGGIT